VRVLRDVTVIVVVHEGMPVHRIVESECDHREKQTQDGITLFRGCEQADLVWGRQQLDLTTEDSEDTEAFYTSIYVITVTDVTARMRPSTEGSEMHFNELSGACIWLV
jgi:hypothetical protein